MNRLLKGGMTLVLAFLPVMHPASSLAVDSFTGLTGMTDSPYYRYEIRGQASVSLRLSQSLWEGGGTAARVAMEKARLGNARYLYADAASSLAFDAIYAHVDVLRQGKLVELARRNVADYEKTIAMLHSRVQNGLATEGDINLVESRLYRAKGVAAEYESSLLAAKANFQKATGMPVPKHLVPVEKPKHLYKNVNAVVTACKTSHPRLLAQQELVTASLAEEKSAQAAFWPKMGVELGPRWQFQDTPQDKKNHGFEAILTAQWNLYDGGASTAAYKRTAAQTRQARHECQNVIESLEAEIYGTWAQYDAARERISLYSKSMQTAQMARNIYYEQYLLGTKGLLDILDADNEYFVAACQYEIANGDYVVAAYRLLALGGELLDRMNIALPEIGTTGAQKSRKPVKR